MEKEEFIEEENKVLDASLEDEEDEELDGSRLTAMESLVRYMEKTGRAKMLLRLPTVGRLIVLARIGHETTSAKNKKLPTSIDFDGIMHEIWPGVMARSRFDAMFTKFLMDNQRLIVAVERFEDCHDKSVRPRDLWKQLSAPLENELIAKWLIHWKNWDGSADKL